MAPTSTGRRVAAGAAVSGGGLSLAGAAFFALIKEEARAARRKVEARTSKEDPPSGDGVYGRGRGRPIGLVVLGDSSAVGLGVERAAETPGVLIAAALAEVAERPVRLVRLAVSGAESRDLDAQVERALPERPDVALIMIGANDVTARSRPEVAVRHLTGAVRSLRAAGCEVVVGTCPDLGTIRPIAQPLRWLARRWSRDMAAAQTVAVVEAGGRTVSLGSILGPASPPTARCSAATSSTRAPRATPRRPRSSSRRWPTPSTSGRPRPSAACGRCAATPSGRSPRRRPGRPTGRAPRCRPPRWPAPTPAPAVRGRSCAAAVRRTCPPRTRRRRSPRASADEDPPTPSQAGAERPLQEGREGLDPPGYFRG